MCTTIESQNHRVGKDDFSRCPYVAGWRIRCSQCPALGSGTVIAHFGWRVAPPVEAAVSALRQSSRTERRCGLCSADDGEEGGAGLCPPLGAESVADLRKITLGRSARLETLLVAGTFRSVTNTTRPGKPIRWKRSAFIHPVAQFFPAPAASLRCSGCAPESSRPTMRRWRQTARKTVAHQPDRFSSSNGHPRFCRTARAATRCILSASRCFSKSS
jgi:hypothetical protein